MQDLASLVGVLATASLGLSAGALLAEAGVLVPFWRSESPESFLAWYKRYAALLLSFFGPLEVASGVLVVVATAFAWAGFLPGRFLFTACALLTVAVLASFPLYFRSANASFESGSIEEANVPSELQRWATWHWGRTILAIIAFLLSAVALAYPDGTPAVHEGTAANHQQLRPEEGSAEP